MNIPYGKQEITDQDVTAVVEALKSDFLTQGPRVLKFEKAFAEYIGVKHAIAVSSGTSALHLCMMSLGFKKGDLGVTSPLTFSASANCMAYMDMDVAFCDIDPKTYLLSLDKLESQLKEGLKPKVVVPVSYAGYPYPTKELYSLAQKYDFKIVEDACHAPGAYITDDKGQKLRSGDCKFTDLAIFSLHPVKHIAAGEGGVVTTNNTELYDKIVKLRTHGIFKDENLFPKEPWRYEMEDLGYNYRMTDLQCALGLSQLIRAPEKVITRNEIAQRYRDELSDIKEIELPAVSEDVFHAYHLFVIQTEERLELYEHLKEKGIHSQVHYVPVYKLKFYKDKNIHNDEDYPNTESFYKKCLSIPMYPNLTQDELDYVISTLREFFGR